MRKIYNNSKGQSLIEIVIAIGLIAIVFSSSWGILHNSYMSIALEMNALKAHYYVIGELEAIRSVRDEDWNSIIDGTWHLEYDDSVPGAEQLILIGGEETLSDGYRRRIEISSVRRNTDTGKITEDVGYDYDQNTKLVEVLVQWDYKGSVLTDTEKIYLTNWARF
ncbi:MAG: prepilin-type N-terminal cleavage/methylation domain-containing protein [Candidatus Dojkabacteria bacterium]|jgi:hypothetical protein|nr:prepilin-type N-terminal cleavage/methylation domain-containing protein [Candidatus Dojkabacteria bacterium]